MGSFEYTMVLVSIVVGLGVTHVLSSLRNISPPPAEFPARASTQPLPDSPRVSHRWPKRVDQIFTLEMV